MKIVLSLITKTRLTDPKKYLQKSYNAIMSDIDNLITDSQKWAKDGNIIIIFANSRFLEKVVNIIISLQKLNIDNYIVVSLDQKTFDHLKEKDYHTSLYPIEVNKHKMTRDHLWIKRTMILMELVNHGISVLHMDADVTIIKDPWELILKEDSDIVATHGTVWPPDVLRRFGFVIRCGFIYYRSSQKVILFLQELVFLVKKFRDDQAGINRLLSKKDIKWDIDYKTSYKIRFRGDFYTCFEVPIYGKTIDGVQIVLLPHKYFPRRLDRVAQAYVVDMIE